jgi:hypothetical protein
MSRKSKERRKDANESKDKAKESKAAPSATTSAILRRRRNKRFLFVGLLGLSFPILEVIAYQFRAITITIINRAEVGVKGVKVIYSNGAFDLPELKPGGSATRVIRPDFSFSRDQFSTFTMSIRFSADNGQIFGQMGRVGALDYSSQEIYTITQTPPEGHIQLQHTTRPGFPLSLVRDLMDRLGFK